MQRTVLVGGLTLAFVLAAQAAGPADTMAAAAQRFLATLSPELKARAQLPFDSDDRTFWNYVPLERKGITLKVMDDRQRAAAMDLLRTGLSDKGYRKAEAIRALEDVLRAMESGRIVRDKELYYFTIYGDPKDKGTWGWRYEGHHLSHNWTIVNGKSIASSPQFLGANPAEVRDGALKGSRPLAAEEDLAFALLNALDESQRGIAVIDPKAPADLLTTNKREAAMLEDRGLTWKEMKGPQREQLMALIEEHARTQSAALAEERIARVRQAGLDTVRFAWMGARERTEAGHYYRIQGPTFLVEFDNTQNRANHIHQVWRDFKGDFGRDLLAEHYRESHK